MAGRRSNPHIAAAATLLSRLPPAYVAGGRILWVDRAARKVDGGKRTKAVSIEEAEEER